MKAFIITVCTFFLFFALVSFASTLEKEVSFSLDDLSFTKFREYDVVRLKGCKTTKEVGSPSLPRAAFSLLLPQGSEVIDVEVISADKEVIPGNYELYPTQHPQPILKAKVFPFVKPNEKIYTQTTPYPERIIVCPHTGSMGGYRISGLLIYPLQYIPADKKLVFYSRIRFKVTYDENIHSVHTKTRKQKDIFKQRIKNIILNPEDIERWSPSIGISERLSPLYTVEYVIITADSLKTTFQELADWKKKKGVPAKVVTLDSIYANYTGVDNAEKVRNFIIDANSSWGTIWVLLGGQCDYEWGEGVVPRRNAWYIIIDGNDNDTLPSDLYFSDLDGSWDGDGDGVYGESTDEVDFYSDVFVGRAPIRTTTQAEAFVTKVITYEKSPPLGYQKKILLPAAYLWPGDYDERLSQEAIANIVPVDWQVSRLYERDGNLTHEAFVDSVQSGFGFAHLVGHGDQNGIYTYFDDAYFNSDDLDTLGNNGLLGVHNSIGCMCGAFDFVPNGDCFAEHYLTTTAGGSYSIMNSRYGWGFPPEMGPSEHIDTCFYHEIFTEDYPYHNHLGVAHAFAKDGYVSQITWTSVWAWCIYELNLFGDPELPLWTDIPEELTVTHDPIIPVGGSSFTVNVMYGGGAVENALVCLYKEGEVYERGYTDASGNITLTLSPPPTSLGTMYCTVTKHNYLPCEGSVDVISPSGPLMVFDYYTVIDMLGDGDGMVDPGESIELPVTIHNVGLDTGYIITGILRTTDPYVTITDSMEEFGDIPPDSFSTSLEDFDFDVMLGCPAKQIINFELITRDINDSTWISSFSIPILTPDIDLSADTLYFNTAFVGYSDTLELQVYNIGTDTLVVSNITSDNVDYSVDTTNFSLPPDGNQTVIVIFTPSSVGLLTGTLTVYSNDLHESTAIVTLQGEGAEPPDISVSPDSLSNSLSTGETSTHWLTIYNTGFSDLVFDISIEEVDTASLSVKIIEDESVRAHEVLAVGKSVSLDELDYQELSLSRQLTVSPTDLIDKGMPFEKNYPKSKSFKQIKGEEVFGNADNEFFAGPRTRGNLFTCTTSTNLIEHRLYINPSISTQLWFLVYEGDSQIGIYNLISASDVSPAGPGEGWYSSGDVNVPLVAGKYYLIVASFEKQTYYYNQQDISPYPILASFGELTAGAGWDWQPTSNFPPDSTQYVLDYAFADPVAYYQTLVTGVGFTWLSVDTTFGTIPRGDSVNIEFTFDATDLDIGDYFADIIIASNDPDEPEVTIPARLKVIGSGIEEIGIPKVFSIYPNYPNPFNRHTVIKFGCPKRANVLIQVFDIMGRVVNTLVNEEVEAGYHEVQWNANDEYGREVASSVYFVIMQVEDYTQTIKSVRVR